MNTNTAPYAILVRLAKLEASISKFNSCHNPAGPGGGEFCGLKSTKGKAKPIGPKSSSSSAKPIDPGNYKGWQKNLSVDQKEAVKEYTYAGFGVNKNFRKDKPLSKSDQKFVAILDSAIKQHTVDKDMVVFRGGGRTGDKLGALKVGAVFKDKGYTSTTINPGVAKVFSNDVVFRVKVPKGKNAAPVDGLSGTKAEREWLLPRGSKFRITGKSAGTGVLKGVTVVDVTLA